MAKTRRLNPPAFTRHKQTTRTSRAWETRSYISGQLPLDPDGKLVGVGDPEAQAEQCYRNIQHIVEYFGGSLDDIVKITQFLTDITHRSLVAKPRDRLPRNARPRQHACGNQRPGGAGSLIEIEAIAVLD